jgi:hypothetical protein
MTITVTWVRSEGHYFKDLDASAAATPVVIV